MGELELYVKNEIARAVDPIAFALDFPRKLEQAIELAKTPEDANHLRAVADMGNKYLRQALPRLVQDRRKKFEYMHPSEASYIKASAKAGALWEVSPDRMPVGRKWPNSEIFQNKKSNTDVGFKGHKDAAACMHVAALHEEDLRLYLKEQLQEESHATLYGAERLWRMLNAKPVEFEIEGMYRVWYADPPWSYGNQRGDGVTEQSDHYPTMTTQDICDIPVKEHALDDAVLFLWATSPILYPDAFKVISAWDFTYKSSFIWDKIKHNMGNYNSVRHEFLLIATRGSCTPDVVQLFDSVQTIERRAHSQKPARFREIIDTIYPLGNRVELFAREKIDGWDQYGIEIP